MSEMGARPEAGSDTEVRPGPIDAVPVRHPGRVIAVILLLILGALIVHTLITNPGFDWNFIYQAMIQNPVIRGLIFGTIIGTVGAMIGAVTLGVTLAVMRLSENKVLSFIAWTYIWFFRAIPRYVLLFVMGSIGVLWPQNKGGLGIGVPFGHQIMDLLGFNNGLVLFHLNANQLFNGLVGGIIGLALSEAAYMAEIARAGIMSVEEGQREAACALGMSNQLAMRRVILPQAMRVIVPPTGNETIAMVKDTTLMTAIPVNNELFFQMTQIGVRNFDVFSTAVGATIWYLLICSILMAIQSRIEAHFGRGFGSKPPSKARGQGLRAKMLGLNGGMSR